jgi:hypothetical protein
MIEMRLSCFCIALGEFLFLGGTFIIIIFYRKYNERKWNFEPVKKFMANFISLSYKGEDYYFIQNSLISDHYFDNQILSGCYFDPYKQTNNKNYFLVKLTFSYFQRVPVSQTKYLVNRKKIGLVSDYELQLIVNDIISQKNSSYYL